MKRRISPKINLSLDTAERMVTHFKEGKKNASPKMEIVFDELIGKWQGWHGTTFRYLWLDGHGMRIQNFEKLKKEVIFL